MQQNHKGLVWTIQRSPCNGRIRQLFAAADTGLLVKVTDQPTTMTFDDTKAAPPRSSPDRSPPSPNPVGHGHGGSGGITAEQNGAAIGKVPEGRK
jgi:hypothetical protein